MDKRTGTGKNDTSEDGLQGPSLWHGAQKVRFPLAGSIDDLRHLNAGDKVVISGTIYTARDQAHARMVHGLEQGRKLPFELDGELIYYAGPCPPAPGQITGAIGPTTSGRMDVYTPRLLAAGLKGMLGKGRRSPEVIEAIVRHGAVYFVTLGGAGALLSRKVTAATVVAYEDLGPEAVYKLTVQDFPAIVGIDSRGRDVYSLAF